MLDTHKNERMKNAITYVVPKDRTMEDCISLNNQISCVVVISIFWFNRYRQIFSNLTEINMRPTFKQFFLSETVNVKKN